MQEIKADEILNIQADIIIDARSPAEYTHSHIPHAKNFYALNDDEHKEVGTLYKNHSKYNAKVLGASYICKNASQHILNLQNHINPGAKIIIYCARGGLRSSSLSIILEQLQYRVYKIKDGYKGYRNYVLNTLNSPTKSSFITLFGNTGVGKSELLQHLAPSIDLENLANHQGSTFGSILGEQPTQKTFENNLSFELQQLPCNTLCFIEGESRRIGNINLPKEIYNAMHNGVKILVEASMENRVERIFKEYANISEQFFFTCMNKIQRYMPKKIYMCIVENYKKNDLHTVTYLLLKHYYDKVYKKPKHVDFIINNNNISQAVEKLNKIKYETNKDI